MEEYNGVMLEAATNEIGLTKARYDLEEASQKYSAAVERMNELQAEASAEADRQCRENGILADATAYLTKEYYDLQNSLDSLNQEVFDAQSSVAAHEKAIEKDADAVAAAEAKMEAAEDAVRELTEAMGDYADGQEDTAAAEAAVQNTIAGTMARVKELADAYAEAYSEAAESFSGQFGLFDEAKADADATVEAAQKALDTQLAYWQGYAANIATLKEISAEDLGVTRENYNALMEYVRSGTPEAAGLAADMVKEINNGNTRAITNLANTLGEISESQDQAAQEVAKWTAGLDEQMDRFINDMEEDIGALDMSEEAAASGRATVQSYVDAAADMLPQVRSTYASVAQAARRALANAVVSSSNWDGSYFSIPGHANGTNSAPPGWAWVGEEGPELMRMRGGEQILPNSVSQQVAKEYCDYQQYAAQDMPPEFSGSVFQDRKTAENSGVYSRYTADQGVRQEHRSLEVIAAGGAESGRANVEMHFHIEAGAQPETVNVWQEYARDELKSLVLEVMEDAEADARRRVMT